MNETNAHPPAYPQAPALEVTQWFNAPRPPTLADLRGRIVVLHAFRCCVPAASPTVCRRRRAIHERFAGQGVTVIGLHTVFEHHQVMTPDALAAFIHEYRLRFPSPSIVPPRRAALFRAR